MSQSNRLTLEDIRTVFRLVGEVAELRLQPDSQRQHLLDALVRLFGAHMSTLLVFENLSPAGEVGVRVQYLGGHVHDDLQDVMAHWAGEVGGFDLRKDPTIQRFTQVDGLADAPVTCTRRDLMTREEWLASNAYREAAVHVGLDDMLASTFPMGPPGVILGMTTQRRDDQAVFSPREQAMFALLNEELWHLYRQGKLTGAGTIEQELSPRLVQLLRMLLLGKTPKRIAYELGLTESTVRTYIRDLYKRVGVSGREELMAKYIREGGIGGNKAMEENS
ncbi:MAG: helix-turn-helix transcriptional regulator [Planctomycetota bacterium]